MMGRLSCFKYPEVQIFDYQNLKFEHTLPDAENIEHGESRSYDVQKIAQRGGIHLY